MTKGYMKQMLQPAHETGSGALDAIIWAHLHDLTQSLLFWKSCCGLEKYMIALKGTWLEHVEVLTKLRLNKSEIAGPQQTNMEECAVLSADTEHLSQVLVKL